MLMHRERVHMTFMLIHMYRHSHAHTHTYIHTHAHGLGTSSLNDQPSEMQENSKSIDTSTRLRPALNFSPCNFVQKDPSQMVKTIGRATHHKHNVHDIGIDTGTLDGIETHTGHSDTDRNLHEKYTGTRY